MILSIGTKENCLQNRSSTIVFDINVLYFIADIYIYINIGFT